MSWSGPLPDRSRPSRPDAGRRALRVVVVTIAVALQLITAVPFTVAIGLVAPPWGIAVAWVLWFAAAGMLVVVARQRPLLTPAIPVTNFVLLFALIWLGERLFGWTA